MGGGGGGGMRCARAVGARLRARGWPPRRAALAEHWVAMLWEQTLAVVPITVLLAATMGIFFGRAAGDPGELTWGLLCAIFGLTLFVDALRVAVMPLGEMLGEELPNRLPLPGVLFVALLLGILCTYAEPAIASLRPLARIVSKTRAPYLHLMLNELQEGLIFAIGLGVGVAAVLGTLRFVRGWSLKPLIAATLVPAVACAAYMQWGDPDLRPLIGLAWDCGAVTTGPVTVPILLALGIGVMKTTKERARAKKLLAASVATSSGQQPTLDGFGIVTLASLLPVLAVEVLAIATTFVYSRDDIINAAPASDLEAVTDVSPVREVIFAVRAILPLNVFLVFLVVVVLRAPLPHLSVFLPDNYADLAQTQQEGGTTPGLTPVATPAETPAPAPACAGAGAPPPPPAAQPSAWRRMFPHGVGSLLFGVLMAQVGMVLFNLGLTYGFTSLGDQVGSLLPASFLAVDAEPGSPLFSFGGGVALTFVMMFVLGFLATRAEPALNVLGATVEKLSGGSFTRALLVYSVCVGVGAGMAVGATKILFAVPVIYFILGKYGAASALTLQAGEDFTNIAWDSAGVTTGPVTVPFVLSTGVGFQKAAGAVDGFGILTVASVAPIITVLIADLGRRTWAAARIARARALVAASSAAAASSTSPSDIELSPAVGAEEAGRDDGAGVAAHGGENTGARAAPPAAV
jgi:hypothetical protein